MVICKGRPGADYLWLHVKGSKFGRLLSTPPMLCSSDIIPVILVLGLGISNGHLGSLASMHMPSLLPSTYR